MKSFGILPYPGDFPAETNWEKTLNGKEKMSVFKTENFGHWRYLFDGFLNRKRARGLLSLDFGRAFVKISYFSFSNHSLRLLAYEFKKTSSLEDAAGIESFISDFLRENFISEKKVRLTIFDPNLVVIKFLTLPVLSKEETLEAAKWQLKEDMAFDINNSIIGWEVVKEGVDESGVKKNEIMCVVIEKGFVDKYLSIIDACSLNLTGISIPPHNYENILNSLQVDSSSVIAVLNIGYKDSFLCIYKGGKLRFMRIMAFSSSKITESLTGTLVSDKGRIELSLEEAEEIKKSFGFPKDGAGILKDSIQAMHVISLIRPLLEILVRELKLSFSYFSSTFKEDMPACLYITGGGAGLKNLSDYLNEELSLKVVDLPFPGHINTEAIDEERVRKEHNQIMNMLGAALLVREAIDLLPAEIKTRRVVFFQKVFLRVFAVILGAVFLFSLIMFNLRIQDYHNRLKNAMVHFQSIQKLKILKQKVDKKEGVVNMLRKDKVPSYGMLRQISNIMPDTIVLNELIMDQQKHTVILKGEVSASGSEVESILTGFMERVESASFFSEASLIKSENISGTQVFEIECDLIK